MTANEMKQEMSANQWIAIINQFGLWIVGPIVEGTINVIGMGRTFEEALEMAVRSQDS